MEPGLIQAAAVLAVEMLRRRDNGTGELPPDVVASAFSSALIAARDGMFQAQDELRRRDAALIPKE